MPFQYGRLRLPSVAAAQLLAVTAAAQESAAPAPADTAAGDAMPSTQNATELKSVVVSADITTPQTEGSESYTSPLVTLGKMPLSIRETPQSVTVITRQRIDDQNITSLPDVLKQMTGVTVQRFDGAGLFNSYNVRGYQVDTVQLDGLAFGNIGNVPEYDPYLYDRVELLRGPSGLFQGAGEPGASLNLARKRALHEQQISGGVYAGSWDAYRAEADVSTPLTSDGRLRARAAGVYDAHDSYLDVVNVDHALGYGTLEYDFTASTTLSVGGAYQDTESVIDQGLPAYADGTLLDVARSTFIGADWNEQNTRISDAFAELEHHLDDGGLLKAAVRHLDREMLYRVARANGAVDADGDVNIQTGLYHVDRENWTADTYANLPFTWLGLEHNLIVGADYRKQDETSHSSAFDDTATMNVYAPDHHIAQPAFDINASISNTEIEQYGVYGQARFKLLEALTLAAGGRVTWWESTSKNVKTGAQTGHYDADGEFTPYAALIYDFTRQMSLYVSYADIFQPQNALTATGAQIKPRVGGQVEGGIKGEWFGGLLNTQFAVFRIEDENRAITVENAAPNVYIAGGKVRSQGFEFEVGGQLLPGWDVTAGYTYVDTQYVRGATEAQTGTTFSAFTPRHSGNLWSKYSFHRGALDGLSIGGGVRAVSRFYSLSGTTRLDADAYTVVAAQLGYRYDAHWSANLTANNLLDEKYYEKVSSPGRQNFYGAPLDVTFALRFTF
jgi:outer membrane receptor for ferric coprogen and ferric-rhodotorulic acid